jgi:Uma2 family endonuclease
MSTTIFETSSEPQPLVWTRDVYMRAAEAGVFGELRVELVEGQVIKMSPAGSRHANTIVKVTEALRTAFGQEFLIRTQLQLDLGEWSQPEPDIAVIRGGIDDFEDHHPTCADLVVEVSESTLRYDRGRKARIYAIAMLPEYWIVNLETDQVEVFQQPDSQGNYLVRSVAKRGERLTPLAIPYANIPVEQLLPRLRTTLDS